MRFRRPIKFPGDSHDSLALVPTAIFLRAMSGRRSFLTLLAAFTLFATGCAKKPGPTGAGPSPDRKVLNVGNGAEPQDLDFQIVTGVPEHRLAITFFEGLVSEDPQLNLIPGVAERWVVSPTGSSTRFTCAPAPAGRTATP